MDLNKFDICIIITLKIVLDYIIIVAFSLYIHIVCINNVMQ